VLEATLAGRGLGVQRVTDMDGWLAYHAAFVAYWARTTRSPMGELAFAAHSRHAEAEMQALGDDMAARITDSPALTKLLRPVEHQP
jgi:ATP/maltotriose-dependent transcriptional regulator MalT